MFSQSLLHAYLYLIFSPIFAETENIAFTILSYVHVFVHEICSFYDIEIHQVIVVSKFPTENSCF